MCMDLITVMYSQQGLEYFLLLCYTISMYYCKKGGCTCTPLHPPPPLPTGLDGCGLKTKNSTSGLQYQKSYRAGACRSGSGLDSMYVVLPICSYIEYSCGSYLVLRGLLTMKASFVLLSQTIIMISTARKGNAYYPTCISISLMLATS